ncbi:MAG: hemolysin family protein [Vicinamibacterales bacterium]
MESSFAGAAWQVAGILLLVFANGFFVAAEFSIVTVRKTRVDQLVAEGHWGARAVRRAVTEPDHYIAATQLGITMASLGLGWVGEPLLASLVQPALTSLPTLLAETTAHTIAVAVAFAIITGLHVVLGELAAKTIALEHSEATALVVVRPTEVFMRIFWPFIRVLNGAGQAVVRVLGLGTQVRSRMVHSEEELKMLVTASQEAGVLEEDEEQMLHRVLGFSDLTASEIMTPRTEIVAVAATAPRDVLIGQFVHGSHTRLPVYRTGLDDLIGFLHVTDLLKVLAKPNEPVDAGALAREALAVPETLRADDLLAEMRRRRMREAIVIDEYGGTAGIVTFESLMERIVGGIGGEFGAAPRIANRPDGSADIDGLTIVADVNAQFALEIDEAAYTTVGGYMLGRLGHGARVGDIIDVEGRQMRVDQMDGLRVARVWLSAPSKSATTENAEDTQEPD